jgi:membrane protease YdiL (CAAX protease family)
MAEAAAIAAPQTQVRPSLARVLFLVVAMTVWADANDWLADRYHIGTWPLIALRTVVDCGGVVWLGCVVWGKSALRDLGWRFPNPLRLVLAGVIATAVVIGVIFAAVAIRFGSAAPRELGAEVAKLSLGRHLFFGVLGLKIGFWEETLFRGDLLRALTVRVGVPVAIVLSSVVFALFHLHMDSFANGWSGVFSFGILLKAAMGLVFAVAATRTRSLLPSAIAHAALWGIMGDS